jgi:hypothetical protein
MNKKRADSCGERILRKRWRTVRDMGRGVRKLKRGVRKRGR